MSQYNTTVYLETGGDKLVIASGGEIEVQSGGTVDFQGSVTFIDDTQLIIGTGTDCALEWDTNQTQDALLLGLGASNTLIVLEKADMTADKALAAATYPQIIIYDANADNYMTLGSSGDDIALVGSSNDIDIRCGLVAGDALNLQAYDVGVTTYEDMITLASHATLPTMILHASGGITANAGLTLSDAAGTGAGSIVTVEGEDLGLQSTDATTAGDGGDVNIIGGAGDTAGAGGDVDINAGAGAAAVGGNVELTGGAGNAAFAGGTIDIDGGLGGVNGAGGPVTVTGGIGNTAANGGAVDIAGGAAGTAGVGGDVNVVGGASATAGAGGAVDIDGGAGTGALGGNVEIMGGAGNGAFAGGTIDVDGGTGGAAGAGGPVAINGGIGGADGAGGAVDIVGGVGTATAAGGDVSVAGGAAGATAGIGGDVTIVGGASATAGAGGAIDIDGGAGAADVGGAVAVTGGAGDGANAGGAIDIDGGAGGAAGAGGAVTIDGGTPASGTAAGGGVTITGGTAGATAGAAGEIVITAGATGVGAGTVGSITLNGTTTFSDQPGTGDGTIDAVAGQSLIVALSDNVATALDIQEATNDYITVNTLNDFEEVEFGVPVDMELGQKHETYFEIFDDFLYQAITENDTPWILNAGTDTEAIDAAILATQENGVIRLTTGDASGVTAADASQIVCHIPMQADNGGLVFETRLNIDTAITDISVNAGFTDSTALEEPFTIAAGTVTAVANDAACFTYDTDSTVDQFFMCAVDSTVQDAGNATTGTAPVADVFNLLRIEVSADGSEIKFFIDGVLEGTLTGDVGVSPDVNLFATVVVNSTTTTSKSADVDFVYAGVLRG